MEEQEKNKTKKKVRKIQNNNENTVWSKLKKFTIEIFIIVFSVSLSIWFHSWNEYRTAQKQVKVFLLGLKTDIQEDIDEVNNLISIYENYSTRYQYLSNLSVAKTLKNDTLSDAMSSIFSNAYLRPNISRYTGFTMSGKLLNIEDEQLTQDILNFYQELIPKIKSSENGYTETHAKFVTYLFENMTERKSEESILKVLLTPQGQNYCERLIPGEQLFQRYNDFIKAGNEIIKAIDEEYPNEKQD